MLSPSYPRLPITRARRALALVALILVAGVLFSCREAPAVPPSPTSPALVVALPTATHTPLRAATLTPLPPTETQTPPPPSLTPLPPTATSAPPTATVLPPTATADLSGRAGRTWLFPGPEHYEGDTLSLQIALRDGESLPSDSFASLTLDGGQPFTRTTQTSRNPVTGVTYLVLNNVLETAGLAGDHSLIMETELADAAILQVGRDFTILPDAGRPAEELGLAWQSLALDCCRLHYLAGTAAERDIELLGETATAAAEHVSALFGVTFEEPFPIVLIDNMWGNGGYASSDGIVISYTDRPYGPAAPAFLQSVFRHEMTHYAVTIQDEAVAGFGRPGFLGEGLAVYVSGGHYKEEDIPARMAALADTGRAVSVQDLAENFGELQHEERYLQSAAVVAYLVEQYGWERFMTFFDSRSEADEAAAPAVWLDWALVHNFDLPLPRFEEEFAAWVESREPTDEQRNDLALTLSLQEARREYQRLYAPYQELYRLGRPLEQDQLAVYTREAHSPMHVAAETVLRRAQEALSTGDYETVEQLIMAVDRLLKYGDFSAPPLADHLAIALVLADAGYRTHAIAVNGDAAQVEATFDGQQLIALTLSRQGEDWRLD